MKIVNYLFRKEKLKFCLPVILFSTFTVLFYGPLGTYLSNTREFAFTIVPVLKICGATFGIAFAVLFVLMMLLGEKLSRWVFQLGFGIALGMYVQAAINIKYGSGVMDGSAIDWSQYTQYAIIDTAVWAVCLLLPFAVTLLKWKNKYKIVPALALFLTVIQIPAFAIQLVNYEPGGASEFSVTKRNLFELGYESNTIIFILDTMDESFYEEFIAENPEYTEKLTGFVHYSDMLASGARTMIGMPSLLTGTPYKNDMPYSKYVEEIWGQENPIQDIAESGVKVDIYSDDIYYAPSLAEYVDNYDQEGIQEEDLNYVGLARKLYKLDGFIYLPHLLKRYSWIDTSEFNVAKNLENTYFVNDGNFHYELWEHDYTFDISQDTAREFKLYHMTGAHEPYTLNKWGQRDSEATRESQIEGVFYIVGKMLDSLKEQGLYDSSTIIITADHGGEGIMGRSCMMLKKANAIAAYTDSAVPASAYDIPYFLYKTYGFDVPDSAKVYGMDLDSLTEEMTRERHIFVNTRAEQAAFLITEYVTEDKLTPEYNWTDVIAHEISDDAKEPYKFGTELSFRSDATANVYCTGGIQGTTGWNSPFYGPESTILLPLLKTPSKGTVVGSFTLGHKSYLKEMRHCQVYFNDVLAFEGMLTEDMAQGTFTASADAKEVFADRKDQLEIKFVFPEISEDELELPLIQRTQTISLWNMKVDVE